MAIGRDLPEEGARIDRRAGLGKCVRDASVLEPAGASESRDRLSRENGGAASLFRRVLPILLCLLAVACGPNDEETVAATVAYEGTPVEWRMGDRIRVEGAVERTSFGYYLINFRVGSGDRAREDCILLRGENSHLGAQAVLRLSANRPGLVAATGRTFERFPIIPNPGPGEHQSMMCTAALEVERVDLLERER